MLECVPNVSEGRDHGVLQTLSDVVTSAGARLVDVHADADHHRAVFTFLGEGDVVRRAALALGRAAVHAIDMRRHRGVHPRLGALDVMPFVPLAGSTMSEAVAAAHAVGRALAESERLPIFFYGEAALVTARRELPRVRAGEFEGLERRLADPAWRPDAGPATPHPTAGAAIIGARSVLIAFNAVLEGADVTVARRIARTIRESSGGLPAVRAIGVPLESRGHAQVAMNLLDYRRTPPRVVAERLDRACAEAGTSVLLYELVGCAPADAFTGFSRPVAGLIASRLLDPALFR